MPVTIEAGDHRDHRTALELDNTCQVRRHIHGIFIKRFVFILIGLTDFRAESAVIETFGRDGNDTLRRAEHIDESRHIVRSEVKHRPRTVVIEERRLSPFFRSAPHDDRSAGKRFADPPVINEFACGLLSAAEESIGSASHTEPLFLRQSHYLCGIVKIDSERFFRIGVFARVQRIHRNSGVNLRRRKIQDNLNFRNRQEFFVGHVLDTVKLLFCGGALRDDVGTCDNLYHIESLRRLEIGIGNHSASDNTDFCFFHFPYPFQVTCCLRQVRSRS